MMWRFHPAARFAEFAPAWRALHAAGPASPLLDADFMTALLEAFAQGGELLACCEQAGETVAMALLERGPGGSWRSFQPAQAPIGPWLTHPGADLPALLAALLRQLPGPLPALLAGITQLDPMLDPRPLDGPHLATLDYIDTARITVTGDFDAYWAGRGKNLRANLKKQRARLAREGIATQCEEVRAPEAMAEAVAQYAALESGGWKGRNATFAQLQAKAAELKLQCNRYALSCYSLA